MVAIKKRTGFSFVKVASGSRFVHNYSITVLYIRRCIILEVRKLKFLKEYRDGSIVWSARPVGPQPHDSIGDARLTHIGSAIVSIPHITCGIFCPRWSTKE